MSESTVRTETILDRLVAGKREELANRIHSEPLDAVRRRALATEPPLPLAAALRGRTVGLIAEIKKASPSAGVLEESFDPVQRAQTYAANGAAAISVLTEERRFLGSLGHLTSARAALAAASPTSRPPLLRKDFLFDPYHLYEARAAGADAVLLIVAVLDQRALIDLLALAQDLGLSALVEVHDEEQVERALAAGAGIIGINNRDLRTFTTSLDVTERLRPLVPAGALIVSESGIQTPSDVERLARAGVDAVLIGEALMRSGDVGAGVRTFSGIQKPAPGGCERTWQPQSVVGNERGAD